MNQKLRHSTSKLITLVGIMTFVNLVWQFLEIIILGHVNPNKVDTIIGLILTYSLYGNFITWLNK